MTDLEKRADEYADKRAVAYNMPKNSFVIPLLKVAYKTGATQETALLSQHILDLQKDKGNLTDRVRELGQQIEKMKKYGKLLQDICVVMGNDPYMVSVGLENRVKVLWDSSEEKDGLKMVEDIENRLLKIKPQDWAEIEKWEIKEK